jgi:taurine--2-oxoglutarate transaminase
VRSLGLYGVIELVKDRATREPLEAPVKDLARAALDRGIRLATRWNYIYVAPPLCIDEADLVHALDILEELLEGVRS